MTTRIGNSLALKWMVLLSLPTVLLLIIVGASIVLICHQDLKGPFLEVEGIAFVAGAVFNFFLARKLALPFRRPGNMVGYEGFVKDISDLKRMEEELRKSEEGYRGILEGIEDGYYEVDLAGNLTFFNDSLLRIYGYPKEEATGMNYRRVTDQETAKKLFKTFNRVYKTGKTGKVFDYQIIRKDGTKRHVEASISLRKNASENATGFRGIIRDVTEHKLAEEALRQSEEKYRTILESIQEGYFEDDLSGNLTFLNDALCGHLGYTREELIGMNYRQRVDGKDAGKLRQAYSELYRTGEPIKTLEAEFVRKDGTKLVAEFSSSLIRDSAGKPIGFRSISRDVTERKRAEEALRQSNQFNTEVISNAAEGIIVYDREFRYEVWNCFMENLTGMQATDVLGKCAFDLFPHLPQQGIDRLLKRALHGETVSSPDTPYHIPNTGMRGWVSGTYGPHRDARGGIIGVIGTVRDITERKQVEEALRESEAKYRSLVANAMDAIFIVQDGLIKFPNPITSALTGYSQEELTTLPILTFIHPDDRVRILDNHRRRLEGEKVPNTYSFRIINKKGEELWGQINAVLITWDGKPATLCFIRDVTERKRSEEALRQSEERYRNILESIEEGYYEVDLAGNFTFLNDSTCEIFGYPREVLMDMNDREYTDQETTRKLFQVFNEVYRTGRPGSVFDYEIVRKDGTKRHVETSISLRKDASGKPVGFRGIIRDVTERKRREEEIRRKTVLLEGINNIFKVALTCETSVEVARMCLALAQQLTRSQFGFIGEVNEAGYFDTIALSDPGWETCRMPKADAVVMIKNMEIRGIWGRVIKGRKSLIVNQPSFHPDRVGVPEGHPPITAFLGIPLEYSGRTFGMIGLANKESGYSPMDQEMIESLSGAFVEVLMRKRAEEALRQSEEKYRNILENIQDGYFEVDLAGNCTFANDARCRSLGYTKEEMIGMNNRQYTDKKNAKRVYQAFNRVYRTGEPATGLDEQFIRKDGAKAFSELSVSLIRDSEGNPIGFRGISRDITERKRAEEALRQSEERYRTILESIEEGYYEADLAGNFTFINNSMCQIFGYPREELMGMNDRQYTDQETTRKLFQAFNEVYRTGKPGKAFDNEIIRKDGTKRHVETSISLRKDASGKPIGFRGILRDVTDKKTIEEQLFQAEKLRAVGEMASGVAHDFNNALAAILGNTQLLLYTVQDEELRETLKIIEQVAKDSSQTVRRLQDFTRKPIPQELTKVDINAVIKDSIEITKPKWKDEAQNRGTHIEMVSKLENIPFASGNASELREVITNMIFNAIEAMHDGGKIEIRTFRKRSDVFIQISDTGIGIAEETKKRIFEPFFTTKPFTNTGLGLSMSYGIVKRFGGEIEVESKVGQGAVFTITLPIGEDEKEEAVDSQPIKKGRKARILVIDDDEFVRSVLSRTLAQADHQVILAENGGKGVQLFKEGEFDVVLTDLGMPGVSGWEVCRMIKEISPHTPVGMITGWGAERDRSKMEEYGLDFFISKPFDFAQVLNVVAETMESRKE